MSLDFVVATHFDNVLSISSTVLNHQNHRHTCPVLVEKSFIYSILPGIIVLYPAQFGAQPSVMTTS